MIAWWRYVDMSASLPFCKIARGWQRVCTRIRQETAPHALYQTANRAGFHIHRQFLLEGLTQAQLERQLLQEINT